MSRGVPLQDLCCPTCGSDFRDPAGGVSVHKSPEETYIVDLSATEVKLPTQWYVQCRERGHQWSIKTLWRCTNGPDEVLLDRLVGQA